MPAHKIDSDGIIKKIKEQDESSILLKTEIKEQDESSKKPKEDIYLDEIMKKLNEPDEKKNY